MKTTKLPLLDLPFGCRADRSILDEYKILFDIPPPDEEGRIFTLNKTGFMRVQLDPISQSFISVVKETTLPVLEIGTAYGAASQQALELGATVIANDIDMQHLLLLRRQVKKIYWSQLYLNHAKFPQQTDFPDHSFSYILLCRVAHFLNSNEMEMALDKITKWLAPNGILYFVTVSPFHYRLKQFLPIYEKRWHEGVLWPGMIEETQKFWPEFAEKIPVSLHVMDKRPFEYALHRRGFITECELFDYERRKDDPENTSTAYFGAIARKIS